jgi:CRISPR-associated endonuclease/helicase Cas3
VKPLAHSGRVAKNLSPQTYADHIDAVRRMARQNIGAALTYRNTLEPSLEVVVDWASTFHDLGKLEPTNQKVLCTTERGSLPINHVDAGTAHLCAAGQPEGAIAVYSHHMGLCDLPAELAKDQRSRQDPAEGALRDYNIKLSTDARLTELLDMHFKAVPQAPPDSPRLTRALKGFERRLLLSSLVDADHTDTAQHYSGEPEYQTVPCRWEQRLARLNDYVHNLDGSEGMRNELRSRVYDTCRSASPDELIWACDSPVGSGKTTAIMAYLLQAAIALNLRHIFVVLPYTNIVRQSAETYRHALTLPGENPASVVAEHHHQAEFATPDLRYLTILWDCPIIVTTAVQFFETLGTHQTARLRKLHQLPGSAVFIDEAHASMPIHLWPFMWDQMKCLAQQWRCRFVLASGSLAKFWENPRILGESKTETLPSMIPDQLRVASSSLERNRIRYQSLPEPLNRTTLCDWIDQHRGPRLVVLNTVQSAAVVARELQQRGTTTLHLSTALAPIHRERILDIVRGYLQDSPNLDWVLVATSCVEAGVDLSFATAFRERCRASSLVQIGGRVNRHGERADGLVWDFVVSDPLLTIHPDFKHGRDVVEDLFRKRMWDRDLTELMGYALEEEFKRHSKESEINDLLKREALGSYPSVTELTRIISTATQLVVVDRPLIEALRRGASIDRRTLLAKSVQLWSNKITKLGLMEVGRDSGLYAWEYAYDEHFLGIMEGVLKLMQIDADGYAIV